MWLIMRWSCLLSYTDHVPLEAINKELSRHESNSQQAIIMEISCEESCCSAGNNQAAEQAGITQHSSARPPDFANPWIETQQVTKSRYLNHFAVTDWMLRKNTNKAPWKMSFPIKTKTYLELKIYFPAKKPVFHSGPWNCGWIPGPTLHPNPRVMMKHLTGDVSLEPSFLHDDTRGFQVLFYFWQTLKHVT